MPSDLCRHISLLSLSFCLIFLLLAGSLFEQHTNQTPSDYSFGQPMLSSTASGMFSSFCHTGPADLAGSSWDATTEGPHNFPEFTDAAEYYTGETEEFYTYGHITPKPDHGDDLSAPWSPIEGKILKAEPMRRMTSRSSAGSHKHRSSKASSSSKKMRPRVQSILSQTSSQMSKLDMSGNAYQESGRLMDVSQYLGAQELDPLAVSPHMAGSAFYTGLMGYPDGLQYGNDLAVAHVNPQIFNAGLVGSPQSWGSLSPADSRLSSPGVHDGVSDDLWSAVPSASSPAESQNSNSPALPGQSPRYVVADGSHSPATLSYLLDDIRMSRKLDVHGNMISFMSQDAFTLPPALGSRRMSGEGETARDHFLYKNAYPQADGLFHCPWEGETTCNHKPEKLKCNYEYVFRCPLSEDHSIDHPTASSSTRT